MTREVLKLALEALGKAKRQVVNAHVAPHGCIEEAITAIKAALVTKDVSLPEQEPVAWMTRDDGDGCWYSTNFKQSDDDRPLYTSPPKREWVGLTRDEADTYHAGGMFDSEWEIYKRVEAKLKELNT